jgi:pentatricopeptide repeat domain-containing protein 1
MACRCCARLRIPGHRVSLHAAKGGARQQAVALSSSARRTPAATDQTERTVEAQRKPNTVLPRRLNLDRVLAARTIRTAGEDQEEVAERRQRELLSLAVGKPARALLDGNAVSSSSEAAGAVQELNGPELLAFDGITQSQRRRAASTSATRDRGGASIASSSVDTTAVNTTATAAAATAAVAAASNSHQPDLQPPLTLGQRRQQTELSKAILARIRLLGRRRKWQEALLELESAREQGVPIHDVMYNATMAALAAAGRWKAALELLNTLESEGVELSLHVYNSALNACAKMGEWQEAQKLMQHMQKGGLQPDEISYSIAITACDKAGELAEAMKLLRTMTSNGLKPTASAYNGVIAAACRQQEVQMVLDLLAEMKQDGIQPDEINYETAIFACARAGWSTEAAALLHDMTVQGLTPSTKHYNGLMASLMKNSEHDRVYALLAEMCSAGVRPNSVTFLTVLKALSALKSATSVTLETRRMVQLLEGMRLLGLQPTGECLLLVIQACARSGEFDTALQLLDEMLQPQVADVRSGEAHAAISAILAACSRAGVWHTAKELLNKLIDLGLKPTVHEYTACISACGLSGQVEEALLILGKIQIARIVVTSTALNQVLRAYAVRNSDGDWQKAVEFLHSMQVRHSVTPCSESYSYTIEACKAAGQWKKADELKFELQQLTGSTATACDSSSSDVSTSTATTSTGCSSDSGDDTGVAAAV